MPSTFTSSLRLEQQANGENSTTWGDKQNNNHLLLEQAIAGYESVALTSTVTYLTEVDASLDQSRNAFLNFTGVLGAATSVIIPSNSKGYGIINSTSGAFDLVITVSGGTGVAIPAGGPHLIVCTGTTVMRAPNALTNAVNTFTTVQNFSANVSVSAGVNVGGGVSVVGAVNVGGAANFGSTVNVSTGLSVGGAATLAGSVRVSGAAHQTPVTVAYATSVTLPMGQSNNFVVSLTGPMTLVAPLSASPGQAGFVWLYNVTAGAVAFTSTAWDFANGTVPSLTATAGGYDLLVYVIGPTSVAAATLVPALS